MFSSLIVLGNDSSKILPLILTFNLEFCSRTYFIFKLPSKQVNYKHYSFYLLKFIQIYSKAETLVTFLIVIGLFFQ